MRYWVSGRGVAEAIDVSGLDAADARRLTLLLCSWNRLHRGPVFRWRGGRRFLRPGSWRVDLFHSAFVRFKEDVLEALRDPGSAREFERELLIEEEAARFGREYARWLEEREVFS